MLDLQRRVDQGRFLLCLSRAPFGPWGRRHKRSPDVAHGILNFDAANGSDAAGSEPLEIGFEVRWVSLRGLLAIAYHGRWNGYDHRTVSRGLFVVNSKDLAAEPYGPPVRDQNWVPMDTLAVQKGTTCRAFILDEPRALIAKKQRMPTTESFVGRDGKAALKSAADADATGFQDNFSPFISAFNPFDCGNGIYANRSPSRRSTASKAEPPKYPPKVPRPGSDTTPDLTTLTCSRARHRPGEPHAHL